MLHIPQKDIEWYKRRPGYYGMVQDNLKKLNLDYSRLYRVKWLKST